jgi:hypothetical protein
MEVNLIRRPAAQSRMWPMLVTPFRHQRKIPMKLSASEGHKEQTTKQADQSLRQRDGTVLAHGPES